MRALFVCVPQTGHVTPLLPLAEAFVAQGDEVLFATGAEVGAVMAGRGLAWEPICPPFGEWFGVLAARTRETPGRGLSPEHIERYFGPRRFGEFGAAAMIDVLPPVARRFSPALVVYYAVAFAAPPAAAVLGVR